MSPDSNIEGSEFYPKSKEELARAVDSAFDYRGDVTLVLKSGNEFVGYVYSRQDHVPEPYLEMFVANQDRPQRIPYHEIVAVLFSGEDTASGKSWEAWIQKKKGVAEKET